MSKEARTGKETRTGKEARTGKEGRADETCAKPNGTTMPWVLIVNGSPRSSTSELVAGLSDSCDMTIAVDRGAEVCRAAGITPSAFCGDADSVSDETRAWVEKTIGEKALFPPEKDDTDLGLAFDLAARLVQERGGRDFKPVLTCACGGWTDHELGVIGQLLRHARQGPMLVEDGFQAMVLTPEGQAVWELGELARGNTFSFVPLTECVVSEENMYWELSHERLQPLSDRGISNVVTTGFARVEVHKGVGLAFLYWGRR